MIGTSTSWWRGARGEWYVVAQIALMALVFFGPRTLRAGPVWPPSLIRVSVVTGVVLMILGLLLLVAGIVRLGRSLSPLPYPNEAGSLVVSGPYRIVRHPMYAGGILLAYGWALAVRGPLTLLYATVLFVFLEAKSSREERWLLAKHPEYRDYQERVAKLIPWVR